MFPRRTMSIIVVCALSISLCTISSQISPVICKGLEVSSSFKFAQEISYYIYSDADFINQGWSGNGSLSDPYVISQSVFESDIVFHITDTRSYFRIENCSFNTGIALYLHNVTNANITLNSIVNRGTGISMGYCEDVTIIGNTILGGFEGVFSYNCNNCSIINNTIASIQNAVALINMSNTSIIGNRLASVEEGFTAYDNVGSNNTWDDGVSFGNSWYDYDGTGVYKIPGSTNSTDHFPTIYYPLFPIDFEGPVIKAPGGSLYVDYMYEYPSHWRFEARVSDPSGVEMVTITVNDAIYEMTHQPTSDDPDLYVYDHPNPRYMTYSFWAVDSLGYETEEPGGFISIGVFGGSSQLPALATILLQISAISTIIILIVWWKRDYIRQSKLLRRTIEPSQTEITDSSG